MMEINVSQQLKSTTASTRNYQVDGIVDIFGDGDGSMVQGEVTLIRTNRGILVKGTLHTEVKATCCRCLGLFGCSLALNIEEEYFPTIDVSSGTPLPLPEEPDAFTIDEHHVLDLTEAVRQYALLAIPMKPLCREDCGGLCPACGHNLNEEPCDCPPQETDPRWSILRKLSLSSESANKRKGTN